MTEWYVLNTFSGYEKRVVKIIAQRAKLDGFDELIEEVTIPQHNVVEIRSGKKRTVARTLMPGYLLIKMVYNEEAAATIAKLPGVSGFIGDGNKPFPLTEEEVANMLQYTGTESGERARPEIHFNIGDQIKVVEGPFANFIGTVDEIDTEKAKLRVMVSIFGRPTPVELDVLQVEGV